MAPPVCVKDVDQGEFVTALAAFLKKSGKLKVPEWCDIVKTGVHKELPPADPDWFYIRCAATARHLFMRSPAGVKTMSKVFGGSQRRGVRPSHFRTGSQNIARKAVQALEQLKMVEKHPDGGRRVSQVGHRDMARIAAQVKQQTAAAAFAPKA